MKRILIALGLIALSLVPASGQQTKAQLNTEVSTNFPDNTSGAITPTILRTTVNDIIASFQQAPTVNLQTGTTYTVAVSDYGKLVTFNNASPVAVALPQATGSFATFNFFAKNVGAGTATITPTTSTINGSSSFSLPSGVTVLIISDGTNYQVWGAFNCASLANSAASCSTDSTNASNISSGTLSLIRLPSQAPGTVLGNNGTNSGTPSAIPARTQLTGNATYYVNGNSGASAACGPTGASTCSAGNDSNDCLTPATACLTTQHVVNLLIYNRDLAGFTATVYLAHGSSSNYAFTCLSPVVGQAVISIQGDGNAPTAVTIAAPAGAGTNAIQVKDLCTIGLVNLAFADNGTNNASHFINTGVGNSGHVDMANVSFGSIVAGLAVSAGYSGSVTITGSNSVTGSMLGLLSVGSGGVIDVEGTINGSSGLTFSNGTAIMQSGGVITGVNGSTFTGFSGVSGPRCFIGSAVLSPDGTDPNTIFPGSSNCVSNYPTSGAAQWVTAPITVNFNVAGDNAITVPLPSGYTQFAFPQINISGASGNISTATFGVFTATGGGGAAIVSAGTGITVTTGAANTNNNYESINATNVATESFTPVNGTIQFRVGTTVNQTAKVQIRYLPVP